MIAALLLLAGGFGLLLVGAEILVRSAAALALRLGISPLIVGLTVVSLGTSSPELVVSLQAALQGASGVAIGNVVGSNICNIGLVLGLSALIRPLAAQVQLIRLDVPVMIASSVVLFGLLIDSRVSRLEAVPLLLGIAVYVFNTIRQSRRESRAATARVAASTPHLRIAGVRLGLDLLLIGSGLALLAWGSDLFVEAAVRLAELLGVSRTVVGLTVVAFGTSLP